MNLMSLYHIYQEQQSKLDADIKNINSCLEKLNKISFTNEDLEKCKRQFWLALKQSYEAKKEMRLVFKKVLKIYGYQ